MPVLRNEQIQEAQSAFNAFIARKNVHPDDHAALLRFLQHNMPMNLNTDVRDPIPDQINRIRLVYQTKKELKQRYGKNFVFTHLHQIGMLLFDRSLTHLVLQRSNTIPPDVDLLVPTNPSRPGRKEASRNKSESRRALERDGKRCLVTNAINPDVCHIIPFGLNSNPATEPGSRTIFGLILPHILPKNDAGELTRMLFPAVAAGVDPILAASDRLYNLLTLSNQVHRYWGYCYFAFKWVGALDYDPNKETQTVQLEFRWMPRSIATALGDEGLGKPRPQHARKGNAFRPVKTETMTPERMSEIISDCVNSSSLTTTVQPQYQQPTGVYPTLVDHESHLPIKSGCIIKVNGVNTDDVPKMKLAIDLQYAAIRLGAMSGAADAIESLDPRVPPQCSVEVDPDTGAIWWDDPTPLAEPRVLGDEEGQEEEVDREGEVGEGEEGGKRREGGEGEDEGGGEELWLLL